MYAAQYATAHPDRAAFIMAATGETVSYAELEARSNRLAHLLRAHGLRRLDHYSIFMENNNRYLESCGAGERAGLYYTCVNSYLKAEELATIDDEVEELAEDEEEAQREKLKSRWAEGGTPISSTLPSGTLLPPIWSWAVPSSMRTASTLPHCSVPASSV